MIIGKHALFAEYNYQISFLKYMKLKSSSWTCPSNVISHQIFKYSNNTYDIKIHFDLVLL